LFRLVFPRVVDPILDAAAGLVPGDEENETRYQALIDRDDSFREARYREGRRWRGVLHHFVAPPARVLDLGAGDGAIELALNAGQYVTTSVDREWNTVAPRLGVRRVIADAGALPFREATFDALICLETIEHFTDARAACAEGARVLREGGRVVLITPPRLRWIFRPDPHFGIRFLLMLPSSMQRRIAARRGFDQPHHFVDRIYTSATSIAKLFPGCRIEHTMMRSRLPKRWFWEAIVLRKQKPEAANQKPEDRNQKTEGRRWKT
jgi:SAM-dependent methyltransferase